MLCNYKKIYVSFNTCTAHITSTAQQTNALKNERTWDKPEKEK